METLGRGARRQRIYPDPRWKRPSLFSSSPAPWSPALGVSLQEGSHKARRPAPQLQQSPPWEFTSNSHSSFPRGVQGCTEALRPADAVTEIGGRYPVPMQLHAPSHTSGVFSPVRPGFSGESAAPSHDMIAPRGATPLHEKLWWRLPAETKKVLAAEGIDSVQRLVNVCPREVSAICLINEPIVSAI